MDLHPNGGFGRGRGRGRGVIRPLDGSRMLGAGILPQLGQATHSSSSPSVLSTSNGDSGIAASPAAPERSLNPMTETRPPAESRTSRSEDDSRGSMPSASDKNEKPKPEPRQAAETRIRRSEGDSRGSMPAAPEKKLESRQFSGTRTGRSDGDPRGSMPAAPEKKLESRQSSETRIRRSAGDPSGSMPAASGKKLESRQSSETRVRRSDGDSRGSRPAASEKKKLMRKQEGDTRGSMRGRRPLTDDVVHSRPPGLVTKTGTSGTLISVQTNYFRVLKRPNWTIYQYRVDFSPEVDSTHHRRAFLREHKSLLGGHIFDGTILFSIVQFKPVPNCPFVLQLTTKVGSAERIGIKIRLVGSVEAADNQQFQVLNLILRRAMEGLNLQLVSRNYFDPQAKVRMENYHLELWPGYQTSIRQHETDILLCAEITHKVMRTDTLHHILKDCVSESDDFQTAFKRQIIGTVVLTDYNNKTYRVDDVDFDSTPLSKFSTNEGETSFCDYYRKRYNIIIRDLKQPLVVSRPTDKSIRGGDNRLTLLIPELCRATGITDTMRANFRLMKAMSLYTRLNPERRIERLRTFNSRLKSSKESTSLMKSWQIELDSNLVEVPARVLPAQNILFGNKRKYLCDYRADWTNEFRNTAMFRHVDIKRWYVITPRLYVREAQDFVSQCIKAAHGMKMEIKQPRYHELVDDRIGSYSQAIDNAVAKDPQIVMIVIKIPNEEKYSCIKKRTCVDRPVPSQVVTLKTIAPGSHKQAGLMSIATKVAIQMNAKLMGTPWMVELPMHGLMTVGFDVCHSSKNKNKSFGALVATMDIRTSCRYYSSVTEHLKGQELSDQMSLHMTCALKAYQEHHGCLPERVLFFRDGVGDGQLHQVVSTEVRFLKEKLDEIYKSAGVKGGCRLAFIVVAKRINTRFFVGKQNPLPGTVVDDVITLPERYDFFLVSQAVRQGTVSPTNYNIIHDTFGLSADRLQLISYKMTHMYYNFSGTCRVPAVCQYAHKLAFLVAESINRAPSAGLENQLYFL